MVDGGRSIGLRSWAVTLQPWAGNEMNQYTEIGSGEGQFALTQEFPHHLAPNASSCPSNKDMEALESEK